MSGKAGRPRKHANESERFRKLRMRMKMEGKKDIRVWLSGKHRALLDEMSKALGLTLAESIEYLVECAFDRELPNLTCENTPDGGSDEDD